MSLNKSIADLAASLFSDNDFNEAAEVIKAASAVIYAIEVDNESNTVSSYAKFYNATTATIGTTVPDMVIEVPAGETLTVVFPQGLAFGTGLTVGCVTVGGTTGVAGPANNVGLELAFT